VSARIREHALADLLLASDEQDGVQIVLRGESVERFAHDARMVFPVYQREDPHDSDGRGPRRNREDALVSKGGRLAGERYDRVPDLRRMMRQMLILSLTLAALGLVACGNSDEAERLSDAEQAAVVRAQLEIHSYCRAVGLYLTRRRGPPTQAETQRVYEEVDRLAALARQKPGAQARNGATLRTLLGDIAEDLEGSNCSPPLEQRVEQALATLPP
jgi:hypothetical protein